MNMHAFVSRVRIRSRGRYLLGAVALAATVGVLTSCNDDNSSSSPSSTINVPNSIAVADVNGDGVPDLLVATTADQGSAANPGFANVILNTRTAPGTFQPGVPYAAVGSDPASIAVADLTGSGALDLVVAMAGTGSVSVFMHGATPGTFSAAVNVNTGGLPNQVVIGDLSGASAPGQCAPRCDLVLADLSAAGNVIVLMANPANPGTFQAPINLPTGVVVTSVQIGDLNGDGLPDIVAATYDDNGNNGAVYVFFQNKAKPGTFLSPVTFPAGAQPESVKIADVNGDGLPDLIVADNGPGSNGTGSAGVSVLLQDATHPGTFLAPVTYATPGASIDVAVGPLSGVGPPDLVVANLAPFPTGSVSVLLHNPASPGTFQTATNYPGFGQPLSVAIRDLNGDGLPDIAVADGASATVLLQKASAPGTFNPAVQVGLPGSM
jgi:FG-GAP-like repeat